MLVLYLSGGKEPNTVQLVPRNSLGGYRSITTVNSDLFSDIGRTEVIENPEEYRLIVLKNESDLPALNIKLYSTVGTGSQHYFKMSVVEPSKDNCNRNIWERVKNPYSKPYYSDFYQNEDPIDAIQFDLQPQEEIGIWIERVIEVTDFSSITGRCTLPPANLVFTLEGALVLDYQEGKSNQTITFDLPDQVEVGQEYTLTGTSSSNLPVEYTSSDTTIAIVQNGKLIPLEDGTVTITAIQSGDSHYNPATPVAVTVEVLFNLVPLPDQTNRVYDLDALAFFGATSIGTTRTRESIDNLVKRLKLNGLWNGMVACWIAAGGQRGLNLKNPVDQDSAFRLTFPNGVGNSGSDDAFYFSDTQFAETHISPSSLNPESICYFSFVKNRSTSQSNATGAIMGSQDSSGYFGILKNARYFRSYFGPSNTLQLFDESPTPFTYTDGVYIHNLYKQKGTFKVSGSKKSKTVSSSVLPSATLQLASINNNGSPSQRQFTDITIAGVMSGLSPMKLNNLYTIIDLYARDMLLRRDSDMLVYGDSIVYGNNSSDIGTKAWRSLVATALNINSLGNVSIGATLQSVNGSTNAFSDRWYPDQYQYSGLLPYNDCVKWLIISIGINDAKNWDNSQNPSNDFNNTYRSLIQRILGLGWPADKIVLTSIGLVDYSGSLTNQPYLPQRHIAFNQYIEQITIDYNLRFADIYTAMVQNGGLSLVNTNGGDGLHPNDTGHQVIANTILSVIQ